MIINFKYPVGKVSVPAVTFFVGVLLAVVVNHAMASFGEDGMIHACIPTGNGSLRIVESAEDCNLNETHLEWGKGNVLDTTPVCPSCDIRSKDISGLNFRGAYLPNANLSEMDLTGTDFSYATLSGADLSDTIIASSTAMTNVILLGTNLSNTNMSNKDLSNTDFGGVEGGNLTNTDFTNSDLSGSHIDTSTITDAIFENANLDGASISNLTNSQIESVGTLTNTVIFFSTLPHVDLSGRNLTGISFNEVDLSEGDLSNTNLVNSTINVVDLTDGDMSGSDISGAIISSSNLTGVTGLNSSTRVGTIWDNTTCPDGTNSNDHSNTCDGHLTP